MQVICEKESCFGCTSCICICPVEAIKMESDIEGFKYPSIDESICIQCNRCKNVCPALKSKKSINNQYFYAVKANDSIRKNSASGGAFKLIADYILCQKGYIIGATIDEKIKIKHIIVSTLEESNKLQGSKYVQSELGRIFIKVKSLLDKGKFCLFSGTPCQVFGLKSFLGKEYKNLVTVDLICHGVPSPSVYEEYIKWIEKKVNKKIVNFQFRNKDINWTDYAVTIKYDDGDIKTATLSSLSFMKLFSKNLILRPVCYSCPFANLNRQSEFTVGDYWGCEKYYPNFYDKNGVSLLIVNSEKANNMCNAFFETAEIKQIKKEEALQNMLLKPTHVNKNRKKFFKLFNEKGYKKVAQKYGENNFYGLMKLIRKRFKNIRKE